MSNVTPASIGLALALGLLAGAPAQAQNVARDALAQCVERVFTSLSSKKATDIEVGRALRSQCDNEVKATLAEAIKSGEASSCTIEKCMQVARDEVARQAKELYRKRAQPSQ